MFRIKTDIRQFKCEDEAKVEDLIRNWVIRPSDLIYQTDDKRWDPIGEHPLFQPIFDQLAQEAQDDPELNPVSEVYEEGVDYSLDEIVPPKADDPKVSEVSEASVDAPDGDDAKAPKLSLASSLSEVSNLPAPKVKPKLELKQFQILKKATKKEEATEEDEHDDLPAPISKAPVSDEPASESSDDDVDDLPAPLPVPQAPEGVEPAPVADEVTVMTERTAELLGLDEEDITTTQEFSAFKRPEAPEGVEPVAPSDETTNVFARHDSDEEEEDKEPKVSTGQGASGVEVNFTRDEDDEDEPRLLRGDLPEELFLTNEISSPFERSALLDELAEDNGSLDADSVWDELAADDLRSTDEFDNPKVIVDDDYSNSSSADEEVTQMTAMADVLEKDKQREGKASEVVSPTESEQESKDLSEASDAQAPEASDSSSEVSQANEASDASLAEESSQTLGEPSDPFTQFDVDSQDIDEVAVEPFEEGESIYETELDPPDEVFVNRGYDMALPFPIGATKEDVPFGVVPSGLSRAQKDKAFPYPKPKAHMELVSQRFGYKDMSRYVIVAFIVIVILVIITAVAFSSS